MLINASILCSVLLLQDDIEPIWDGALIIICQATIIVLGTISSLASLAEKICIQKDWVVVVANSDKDVLASESGEQELLLPGLISRGANFQRDWGPVYLV